MTTDALRRSLAEMIGLVQLKYCNRDGDVSAAITRAEAAMYAPETAGDARNEQPRLLEPEQVEWVVNDIAELGVKIGNQFFFLYKGHSLVYGDDAESRAAGVALNDDKDPPTPHRWRPVLKREFGECCHPVNYQDPARIGTVSPDDSDEWRDLPAAPETEG